MPKHMVDISLLLPICSSLSPPSIKLEQQTTPIPRSCSEDLTKPV